MSSSSIAAWFGRSASAGIVAALVILSGCQVQPLYSETSPAAHSLGSIAFSDAKDRVSQEVRNHLIFVTAGGAGEPANPEYRVDLRVKTVSSGVLLERSSDTAKAGRVVVSADYTVTRTGDATVLRAGHRQAVALVDYPAQEFAKLRAIRDAENRAARQLAELIRADLAAVLGR